MTAAKAAEELSRHDAEARRERLREAINRHGSASRNPVVDAMANAEDGPTIRWLTISRSADAGHSWPTLYDTLPDALEGLADEALDGNGPFFPQAIYDLDTGRSVPFGARFEVYLSDDPGATTHADLSAPEGRR